MTPKVMATITGSGTQDITGAIIPLSEFGKDTVVIQTEVGTSVGSIVIEGRLTPDNTWYTVYSVTTATMAEIPTLPEMRAVITNANGLCSATAWVY